MNLDALFINPSDQKAVYQDLSADLTALEPPVWCRLLMSYVRGKGYSADIWDMQIDSSLTALKDLIEVDDPRLIVVVVHGNQPSASTQTMPAAIALCKFLKQNFPDYPLLVVGGHPAALPQQTLKETGADFVCTGEGPTTVEGLLAILRERQISRNPNVIPNYAYLLNEVQGLMGVWDCTIRLTPPAPNIQDLSEMLGGCWEMLPMNSYRAHIWHCLGEESRTPYASIYTSLGCPFSCGFCMIQSQFRDGDGLKFHGAANSYRLWKPKMVIDELTLLQDTYGVRNIKIADEMFVLNREHVEAISQGIIDRGLDLNVWAYARVDTVKRGPLSKMKRAGINWLALGIESASEHVRDGVEKADYGRKEIVETCRIIREEGINVIGNFIFGLPDDTRATMEETLDLAQEIMPEWVNFYPCQAYPGSKLYQQALKEGWSLPDTWLGYSMHSYETQPLPTATLTATDVLEFSDNAFRTYFTSGSYLAMIRRKFGDKAVEQIKAMTARRLPRRLLDEREFRCA